MRAAVNCVMLRGAAAPRFGGCESSVLLLDLDGKFDTLRFLKILTARVKDAIARAAAEKSPAEAANSRDDALADDVYAESARVDSRRSDATAHSTFSRRYTSSNARSNEEKRETPRRTEGGRGRGRG